MKPDVHSDLAFTFPMENTNTLRNEIPFLSEFGFSLRNGIPFLSEFGFSLRNGIPFLSGCGFSLKQGMPLLIINTHFASKLRQAFVADPSRQTLRGTVVAVQCSFSASHGSECVWRACPGAFS